jgi:selenide,water dikinase
LIANGIVPGGTKDNAFDHATFTTFAATVSDAQRLLLSDATTSGGLLIAVSTDNAARMLYDLADLETVRIIGAVVEGPPGTIVVR